MIFFRIYLKLLTSWGALVAWLWVFPKIMSALTDSSALNSYAGHAAKHHAAPTIQPMREPITLIVHSLNHVFSAMFSFAVSTGAILMLLFGISCLFCSIAFPADHPFLCLPESKPSTAAGVSKPVRKIGPAYEEMNLAQRLATDERRRSEYVEHEVIRELEDTGVLFVEPGRHDSSPPASG